MIRMVQSVSAAHAKSYYSDALLKSDYYLEDQELGGAFRGRLADRLGLGGKATKEQFFALCENLNPTTGKQLTPRKNENRTTGYDINFHVPKSVSIVHVLSGDDHILEAFQKSVSETMADIEADAQARIRKDGVYADRTTGELLWIDFIHQTARPVEGQDPDPHLHAHCYVFNATWDKEENGGRCKAGQFRGIMRDMPYYRARFHKRLSDRLIAQGYQIRRTKNAFEIEGVPQRIIDHFSKRTDEIGRIAKEKGITDAKALDELGAKTRAKKQKGVSMAELKKNWRSQIAALGSSQKEGSLPIRHGPARNEQLPVAEMCLEYAMKLHFEKASVVPDRRLLATAYTQGIGAPLVTIDDLDKRFENDPSVLRIEEKGQLVSTTKEILKEEKRMVVLAQSGKGQMTPLYAEAPKVQLKDQQGDAVKHILTTTDRVSIIRGAAGSGKTTLMREAVSWMKKAGKEVTVVAPTSAAARDVLRGEGFEKAQTVAALWLSKELQVGLQDGVLWVDEAGMLGTSDMTDLLELATKKNARLILGGDTRQHSSVVRGDALRILSKVGGIKTAEVAKIYRQKDETYKSAVGDLFSGRVRQAFEKLESMNAVVEVDAKRPNDRLIEDYIQSVKKGRNALAISPTNEHRQELTAGIRKRMRTEGMIGKKEITVDRLENKYLSAVEKDDWKTYKPGQAIQFVQNTSGIQRGSQWTVKSVAENQVLLAGKMGKKAELPLGRVQCFDVLERAEIPLSKGDTVKITRNGFDLEKKRMDNGQMLEVVAVRKNGQVELQNKVSKQRYHINDEFGHLDHAHCVTSYASQGKTVDDVFIAQPAATFSGTNAKQFYVSVSRAKEGVKIYTDDKKTLLAHAKRSGDRTAALEVEAALKLHGDHIHHRQREEYNAPDPERQPHKDISSPLPSPPQKIDLDYEPRF